MSGESRADVTKHWGEKEEQAFARLKEKSMDAPELKIADYEKLLLLEIDASFDGLGAVLSQENEGKLHPVALASRGLRNSERKMSN